MSLKKIHFIGIGGTGMSAIALLLLDRGLQVSGSDLNDSHYFRAVTAHGANTALGHHPELAVAADVVVRSSAIKDGDPEVSAALSAGVPVLKRSDFLHFVTDSKTTLAVAGSHGKTTTTAMLISLLQSLHLDPSFILGAEIKGLNTNAHHGLNDLFVIEADEYDYMFLGLYPKFSVITNLEHDHPDCFPTIENYLDAFGAFLSRTDRQGKAALCGDDPGVIRLMSRFSTELDRVMTYGFGLNCDYRIVGAGWRSTHNLFSLELAGEPLGSFEVGVPGKHNLLNAAAALSVVHQLGLDLSLLSSALRDFQGTERRFDIVYSQNGQVIINDYGHHPTQINTTISAVRELYPHKRLWAVWEPHTYSRTVAMKDEFIKALNKADKVIITQIYAARETDTGLTPQPIADALPHGRYLPEFSAVVDTITSEIANDDVVVVFSAGKGPQLSADLVKRLQGSAPQGGKQ